MGTAEQRPRRKSFNKKVSRARVWVEHAFGKLKKCFPSLRFMGTSADIQDTYRAIEALMVIHNICIDLGDAPPSRNQKESDIPDSDSDDDPPFEPNDVCPGHLSANQVSQLQVGGWDGRNETAEWLRVEGRRVRDELQVLTHNRAAARR